MTFDEAAALVRLAGWELEIWESATPGEWYYDVHDNKDTKNDPFPPETTFIRNSAPVRGRIKARNAFIEWVEEGMPIDSGMPDHRNRETCDDFR